MIWFTSDLHFGHANVLRYCNRPFLNLHSMHSHLIEAWNFHVKPEDTIYVLGDLAMNIKFRDFKPLALQLNGHKILIKGNHDTFSNGQYAEIGFTVYHELKMRIAGRMCRLSHYPYAEPWYRRPFMYKSELRYMDRRPPKIEGEWLLHGHTHSKEQQQGQTIHVGADAWDYCPVPIRRIESLMDAASRRIIWPLPKP